MARKKIDLSAPQQAQWLPLLLEFIEHLSIDSKETGVGPLNLYGSQKRFLAELVDGLNRDIHTFVFLKARQLGISTVSLAVDLFWLVVHPGLQGALVTDTDGNRDKFRILINRFIASLPAGYQIKVAQNNRANLVLENGSVLDYIVAGTRRTATEVGRSRAYNFIHATEVANFGAVEGIVSLFATLAEKHPDRLYIFESTAKGYNLFWTIWQQALSDPFTQKACFIGWWAKEDYSVEEGSEIFKRYWDGTVTEEEQTRVNTVWKKYGVKITPAQLAWYRWKLETRQASTALMDQDFPWDEDDAFLQTGQNFFPTRKMAQIIQNLTENPPPFLGYAYDFTEKFMDTKLVQVKTADEAELKIYEPPSDIGEYVMGIDPAFGRSENQDRSVVQVCRCYSDKLVQVAEFASSSPESYQVAWVMAHLAGVYQNVMLIVEISGPGEATVLEMKHLRELFDAGALPTPGNGEIGDLFGAARWYMYHKTDSPGAGFMYNWKCLALDTPLPTPSGWTTMGDVKSGEKLLDESGRPCTVTSESPVQINHECYRISFDDGSSIVADADHLWPVHRNIAKCWGGGITKLRKTSELRAGKYMLPVAAPLHLPERELPIHPYILGVWLGDGCSVDGRYFGSEEDIKEIGTHLEACGAKLGILRVRKTVCDQNINGLRGSLRALGVLGNKCIPSEYLRASVAQRLELLQGLMDTDGSSGGNGGRQCSFSTSSQSLSEGFSELLRGLGFKAKFCMRYRTLQYRGGTSVCEPAYQYWFTSYPEFPVFKLRRKQERIDNSTRGRDKRRWHKITSVEKISSVPVKCIAVDSPSRLYLAGDGMIPTHNTNQDNKLSVMNQLRDSLTLGMVEIRSIQAALEIQSLVQDGFVIEPAVSTSKDDRVFGLAFAHRAWVDWVRGPMISANKTYELVTASEANRTEGDHDTMVSHIITNFFESKVEDREEEEIREAWGDSYDDDE